MPSGLNPAQHDAVMTLRGPLLVLAGAGTGKTRVVTFRIAQLIKSGVPADRILAVTFTRKAAGEMQERAAELLNGGKRKRRKRGAPKPEISTFHSLCVRVLRRHATRLGYPEKFTIADRGDQESHARTALREIRAPNDALKPGDLLAIISQWKMRSITPAQAGGVAETDREHLAAVAYRRYQNHLKNSGSVDFDDLLYLTEELFRKFPSVRREEAGRFDHVMVDEYQDTNHSQYEIVRGLAMGHRNLCVVGDDDQSIYGWRGADLRNILDFETTWPGATVVRLEQNYRSTAVILEAANEVIAQNVHRKGKTLRTDRVGGEKITRVECFDENDEAAVVVDEIAKRYEEGPALHNYRDFAILYRTNAQSRALEDAFRRKGVPYQIVGGVRFYERREIQDVMGYLRLLSNPLDEDAFHRVVNYPRRGIGGTSVKRLQEAASAEGLGLLDAAARATSLPGMPTGGARALEAFAHLVSTWSARAATLRVGTLLEELVEELDLVRHLEDEGPEGEDRIDNVRELIAGALDFDAELLDELDPDEIDAFSELDLFLQRVALVADVDRLDADADTVTLMTLHNAKGLEFPMVFITGLEDGLFPLSRAYDEPAEMEEERRLFYVGITRARDVLQLCHARQRRRAGEFMYGRLSPFVEAVPDDLLQSRLSRRLDSAGHRSSTPHRRRPRFDADDGGGYVSDDTFDTSSYNQDSPRYVKGERVLHDTFGSGTVKEVTGFGKDTKVTVDFDDVGRKRLLVRYANLEKDWTL